MSLLQVLQTLDTVVLSAVTPAYKAMETAVKSLRGRVEGVIREKIEPLFKAQAEIKEKIQSRTSPFLVWMSLERLLWCRCNTGDGQPDIVREGVTQACWHCTNPHVSGMDQLTNTHLDVLDSNLELVLMFR